jgi:hypothetical protein
MILILPIKNVMPRKNNSHCYGESPVSQNLLICKHSCAHPQGLFKAGMA